MKKNNAEKMVRVYWLDACIYAGSSPKNKKIIPTRMTTQGILLKKENKENKGIYIKNPHTVYEKTEKEVSKQKGATFLFIPQGMITKIKPIILI